MHDEVLEILKQRKDRGDNNDGQNVWLFVGPGGMKGVRCAGMLAALEDIGLKDAFDGYCGVSAGFLSLNSFVDGTMRDTTKIFWKKLCSTRFIKQYRFFTMGLFGEALDIKYLLKTVLKKDIENLYNKKHTQTKPIIAATFDIETAEEVLIDVRKSKTLADFYSYLFATTSIPVISKTPIKINYNGQKRLCCDGGAAGKMPQNFLEQIKPTHVLWLDNSQREDKESLVSHLLSNVLFGVIKRRKEKVFAEHFKNADVGRVEFFKNESSDTFMKNNIKYTRIQMPHKVGEEKSNLLTKDKKIILSEAIKSFEATYKWWTGDSVGVYPSSWKI
jgi:predicted acylesterase/phospholipase RssA